MSFVGWGNPGVLGVEDRKGSSVFLVTINCDKIIYLVQQERIFPYQSMMICTIDRMPV